MAQGEKKDAKKTIANRTFRLGDSHGEWVIIFRLATSVIKNVSKRN